MELYKKKKLGSGGENKKKSLCAEIGRKKE